MIQITDYTHFYYQTMEGQPPPPFTDGKFVLILQAEGPIHAVFSPIELSKFHADIVCRFLKERGVRGHYDPGHEKYTIDDQGWKIAGGGAWILDTNEEVLQLGGHSKAYGAAHASHLKALFSAAESHFKVRVIDLAY